jgi:hypothetical protein
MRQPSALLLILDSASSIRPFRLLWNALHDRQVSFLDRRPASKAWRSASAPWDFARAAGNRSVSRSSRWHRLRLALEAEPQSAEIISRLSRVSGPRMNGKPGRLVDHQASASSNKIGYPTCARFADPVAPAQRLASARDRPALRFTPN